MNIPPLVQTDRFLDRIINTISDPVFVKDNESRMVLVNDACCQFFGLNRQDILGKTLAETVPEDERASFLKIDREVLETGIESSVEELITIEYNETKIINTKKTRYQDENGNNFLVCVVRDITHLKRNDEMFKLAMERLDLATQAADVGIFDWDIINNTLNWNDQHYTIYGVDKNKSHLVYEDWLGALHPEDKDRVQKELFLCLETGEKFESTFRLKMKSGEVKYVKAISQFQRNDKNELARMIGINLDITIQQQQLQLMARAERLESIGILAGGIAHDFNNLLAGIFGYLELAQGQLKKNKLDQLSETLEKSAGMLNRAKNLSTQLLTFSKGGSPLIKSQTLNNFIVHSAEFALSGSNIELALDIDPDLWPADVDENQFGQVIDNIVINGKQAQPHGGKILIRARNIESEQLKVKGLTKEKYIQIDIQDNGQGISVENLPYVFDPFFTTKKQGSGIGLATVYSIIKRHNGLIEVQSEVSHGTTFTIYLPASGQLQAKINKAKPEGLNRKLKVLILEDEIDLLDIMTENLVSLGCETFGVRNGNEAISKYQEHYELSNPFDLLILDLTIPGGIGGKEVIKAIHKIHPSVKAIATSGYANDSIIADPKKYHFQASLPKPFVLQELIHIMNQIP